MNMKKIKKFFTLARRHDGFTLVELIVVIAILAILGGVAVPAYSGYVKKANMQADISLAAEVADALLLYYYSHPGTQGGYVILSTEEAPRFDGADDASVGADAMKAVFGDAAVNLKYDGWSNSQADIKDAMGGSSFVNPDDGTVNMDLVDAVDNLTGQICSLQDVWRTFDGFTGFLGENGINYEEDPQKAANSAVVYLAQGSEANKEHRDKVSEALIDCMYGPVYGDTFDEVIFNTFSFENGVAKTGDSECTEFEVVAMMYSVMAGYCLQNEDQTDDNILTDDFTNGGTVENLGMLRGALQDKFAEIIAADPEGFQTYLETSADKDIDAYYGVIDGISENQDYLMEKLGELGGSENFYAGLKDYLSAYWSLEFDSGEVAVVLVLDENGQPEVVTYGLGA